MVVPFNMEQFDTANLHDIRVRFSLSSPLATCIGGLAAFAFHALARSA
jgi:hypothetical protein